MSVLVGNPIELREINGGKSRLGGTFLEHVYEGTQDAINSAFNQFQNLPGVDSLHRVQVGGNLYRLIVRRDDVYNDGPVIHEVRLQTHRIQKSIFEPPLPLNLSTATIEEIAKLKQELRKRSEDDATTKPSWLTGASQGINDLYDLVVRGVKSRIVYQPHLIKSSIAINTYAWLLSFTNIGSILSYNQVVQDAQIVTPLRWALPNDTSTDAGFRYGWLKHGPDVNPTAENLEMVTQDYEYGLWPDTMYPDAVLP